MGFEIFSGIFFTVAMLVIVFILLWFGMHRKTMRELKPIQYVSYKKERFNKDFEFACQYCGTTVSTKQKNCPKCGGAYGKNKEYKEKKRAMNQSYLNYLKIQEEKIAQEIEYIEKTKEALRKNKVWKSSVYNFELGEPPIYKPAVDYVFACDYCDNKLRGKSTDETGCPNCGAPYKENLDLLVREEEDRVEKRHYEEYLKLKDFEYGQNLKNEQKDAYIEQKYAKQINFINKNAKYIAIVVVLLIMLFAVGMAVVMG